MKRASKRSARLTEKPTKKVARRVRPLKIKLDKSLAWDEFPGLLTPREREVLAQFMLTPSDRQVAASLGTSAQTVTNQMLSIERKLAAASRSELMVKVFSAYIRARLA
jgi:DNA-binding CsgD family transcriptional regulator